MIDFHVVIQLDVASRDGARALLVQTQLGMVARIQANGDQLEVEQDIDDILLHPFDAGVFVQYAVDLCFRYRATRHGGQKNAAQGITQGMPETPLERFDHNARMTRRSGRDFNDSWLQKFGDG